MYKNIISTTLLAASMNTFACSYISPNSIKLGISLDNQHFFTYDSKNVQDTIASVSINNCTKTAAAKQYLMISFGPEVVSFQDDISGTNYNRIYPEINRCELINSPFEKQTSYENRKKVFDKKWEFISKCIDINVIELGSNPLVFPKEQEGCTIRSISPKSAKFSGGYCFFLPNKDTNLNVSFSVSNDCLQLSGYKESDIDLQDLNADLSAYTSMTYKGELDDLTQFGSTAVRASINPVKEILKPSDDFGILRPTFPANFQVDDLHLGKIAFNSISEQDVSIHVPFIVNNATCDKNIFNGVSSSACDYAAPFVGEISLKDSNGLEVFTWLDGGVATANWQGIISGLGMNVHKEIIPTKKQYTLEVSFGDPHFYFSLFRHESASRIGGIISKIPRLSNSGTISDLADINILHDVNEMIFLDPITGLNLNDKTILSLNNSLKRLNNYLSTSMFPPTYEKVCNSSGKCIDASNNYAKFTASFYLNADYSISKLEVSRTSSLLSTYIKTTDSQPEYVCK